VEYFTGSAAVNGLLETAPIKRAAHIPVTQLLRNVSESGLENIAELSNQISTDAARKRSSSSDRLWSESRQAATDGGQYSSPRPQ
jgi:hypothetical protein